MTLLVTLALAYNLMLLGIAVYALVRGDGPEMAGAAINVGASLLTDAVQLLEGRRWASLDLTVLGIDLLVALSFLGIARASIRFWPIWCLAFTVDDLVLQLARLVTPGITNFAYATTASGVWAYLSLIALWVGTERARRARVRLRPEAATARTVPAMRQSNYSLSIRERASAGWRKVGR